MSGSVLDRVQGILNADPVVPYLKQAIRNPIPSATDVPQVVKDWAAGRDLCLSWQTYSPEHLSRCHVKGIRPIVPETDFDDAVREDLPDHLFYISDEGLVQSGNACLCVQPREQRERYMAHIAETTRRMEGSVGADGLAAAAERAGVELITPPGADTSRADRMRGIR